MVDATTLRRNALNALMEKAIIAKRINNNRFTIRTSKPNIEVSCKLPAFVDAYANDHRFPVEEEKTISQRGSYLYPDGYASTKPALASANRELGGHRGIRSDKQKRNSLLRRL